MHWLKILVFQTQYLHWMSFCKKYSHIHQPTHCHLKIRRRVFPYRLMGIWLKGSLNGSARETTEDRLHTTKNYYCSLITIFWKNVIVTSQSSFKSTAPIHLPKSGLAILLFSNGFILLTGRFSRKSQIFTTPSSPPESNSLFLGTKT